MKRLTPLLLLVLITFSVHSVAVAQFRKVPGTVTDAFKAKYPDATQVEWKDKLSAFAAAFYIGNLKHEARFNSKGQWLETEFVINKDSLPKPVADGLDKSKYAEWNIEDAYKILLPGDVVQYRLEAEKSSLQRKNLLFNSDGRLLKDKATL
ncbi:MAG: PepSY-like domain-containing protein [Chitinophagaceae bacterium]